MRVSSNPDDSGYRAFAEAISRGQKIVVRLNGIEVSQCTMADEELGLVTRCVLDAEGRPQLDPTDRSRVWVETVEGKVEVLNG